MEKTSSLRRPDYPYAVPFERYRVLLDADFARMRSLAERARYEVVPFCDGWRGADVLRHTATVYLHKVAAIAAGRSGQPPRPWPPEHLGAVDAVDLLDDAYAQLIQAFDAHDPADPSWTWWPDDQSVGFWIRRMAHETSVHRRDVENALGEGTPVADNLAIDGIDEVLALMLEGDWSSAMVDAASGSTVEVASGEHAWALTLESASVRFSREPATRAAARVSGSPSQVLLWLWGRGPLPRAGSDAPAPPVQELRDRLALATR